MVERWSTSCLLRNREKLKRLLCPAAAEGQPELEKARLAPLANTKVASQRRDFLHKQSRQVVDASNHQSET
jgi:hypothetical protein